MLTIGDPLPAFELQAVVSREPGLDFAARDAQVLGAIGARRGRGAAARS
jgi:hypothetical protein